MILSMEIDNYLLEPRSWRRILVFMIEMWISQVPQLPHECLLKWVGELNYPDLVDMVQNLVSRHCL